MLQVKFVEMGYRRKIPKDQIAFLKVTVITNYAISAINWKQLEP